MKILSWNINGIRASKVDLKVLFDSFNADVICLQETKITRDMLDEPTAIVDGYNSYFSFSRKRSGYSGVANFCKDSVTPHKAEEGLSGVITTNDQGSVGHYGNHTSFTDDELTSLDAEGRTVITQHQIRLPDGSEKSLSIINVYCPRFDPDREDRHLYKLRFFALLQTRAEALLTSGSHVIILGDINTTHRDLDNCEPNGEESSRKPSRLWMNQLLWEHDRDVTIDDVIDSEEFAAVTPYTVGGKFVDTFRHLHPDQEGAYTNWCTLTNARATNYGRRLDYILGDVDLVKTCLISADICPDVDGSDHCPVTIDIECMPTPATTCPPFCTKFMPEFSGKQQKLSMFFTKLIKTDNDKNINDEEKNNDDKVSMKTNDIATVNISNSGKRPLEVKSSPQKLKKQKTDMKKSSSKGKQSSVANFFSKNTSTIETSINKLKSEKSDTGGVSKYLKTNGENIESDDINSDSKKEAVVETKEANLVKENSKTTANAWKSLLGGLGPAPLCKGHNEPCVLRMVKKAGPTKGKQFYTCARGEGLKTNPEARCDYFKWITNTKKAS